MIDPSSKSDCCGHPVRIEIVHGDGMGYQICTKCGEECFEVNPDPEPTEPILTDDGIR